jgi:protein O-GlcNAc transferase
MNPNRNAPCPCCSGKKYKHCCETKQTVAKLPVTELNQLGQLVNAGQFAVVETRATALLQHYPDEAGLWKLLAIALQMQNKSGLVAFQQAATLLSGDAGAHMNLGNALQGVGRLEEAVQSYQRALAIKPTFAEAHNNLGASFTALGQLEAAAASYRRAVQFKPDFASAHSGLGGVLRHLEQWHEAEACYRHAIKLQPDFAEAHNNLGVTLRDLGQFDQAVTSYRQALKIQPDNAEVLSNLGVALRDLGQLDEAALATQPDDAETLSNLGLAWHDLGRLEEAVKCYRHAIVCNAKLASAYNNLGNSLRELDKINEALLQYQQAIEIEPLFVEAHTNSGVTLQSIGQIDKALQHYHHAYALSPHSLQHAIQAHLLLPVIPASVEDIMAWRERFTQGITTLLNLPPFSAVSLEHLSGASFHLAYHNTSDRPVMEALRHLYRTRVPDLTFTAPHVNSWKSPATRGQRIKVGCLSEFLVDHTIGKHYQGFIEHLDRSRFEVVVMHSPKAKRDSFRANLDALADKAIALPPKLKQQQQVIAAEQLDVLFYPDIGMSSTTYFLAYSRLAPVQATSWGHPDTTGLDTMDYYVSATSNEADNAQGYYTERLVRLNRLPCFYYQTPATATPPLTKAELGLPTSGVLYGCPQALFKIHPDFDAVLADIAVGDRSGHILLPEGTYPEWTALLKARWATTYPVLLERVVFMPRMKWDLFMAMLSHMDVLLDPLHFGSGNTFYDAMLCGTPVVTWPGTFGRGRNVAAAYQQMQIADAPVAQRLQDYAPLALALGRDPVRREALRKASLEAASQYLFEDKLAVQEFESFLTSAVTAASQGELLSTAWRAQI